MLDRQLHSAPELLSQLHATLGCTMVQSVDGRRPEPPAHHASIRLGADGASLEQRLVLLRQGRGLAGRVVGPGEVDHLTCTCMHAWPAYIRAGWQAPPDGNVSALRGALLSLCSASHLRQNPLSCWESMCAGGLLTSGALGPYMVVERNVVHQG